jgi:hypothetical protein
MKEFSLSKVYQLLEPGPVILLTTASKGTVSDMAGRGHLLSSLNPGKLEVLFQTFP